MVVTAIPSSYGSVLADTGRRPHPEGAVEIGRISASFLKKLVRIIQEYIGLLAYLLLDSETRSF
jgi:hypothetical protein